MAAIKTGPSLLIIMGSMDWLTTIIGIVYFGAVEGNPFLSEIARTNLPVYTAIKLSTAVFVGFLFYQAEKTLSRAQDKNSKGFAWTRQLIKVAYVGSAVFLLIAVLNNIVNVALTL